MGWVALNDNGYETLNKFHLVGSRIQEPFYLYCVYSSYTFPTSYLHSNVIQTSLRRLFHFRSPFPFRRLIFTLSLPLPSYLPFALSFWLFFFSFLFLFYWIALKRRATNLRRAKIKILKHLEIHKSQEGFDGIRIYYWIWQTGVKSIFISC